MVSPLQPSLADVDCSKIPAPVDDRATRTGRPGDISHAPEWDNTAGTRGCTLQSLLRTNPAARSA